MLGSCVLVACSGKVTCPEPNLDIAVCDPAGGAFTIDIDNAFMPLPVGHHLVLEGSDEGTPLRVEITVLDETEDVAGVTTRVVEEAEWEDGELVEVSRNYFAQAADGTLCYFGEAVDDYENGEVVSHGGAWRADEPGHSAGIMMPGDPQVGQVFYQEYAPGSAEDMSEIVSLGEEVVVPAGTFTDTLRARDCNPLAGEADIKHYVRGIGLAVDEDVKLTEH